jgi:GTP cyclohydrolase I
MLWRPILGRLLSYDKRIPSQPCGLFQRMKLLQQTSWNHQPSLPDQREGSRRQPVATVADISMSVHLPHHFKGTHMSRFLEVLSKHEDEITLRKPPTILHELKERLDAESAHMEVCFPYFVDKAAPVSGARAKVCCQCTFSVSRNGRKSDIALRVVVASAPVYALLKRPDERHVTMQAHDNPVFVEDLVRNVALFLKNDPRVSSFEVQAVNRESIHAHDAFARVRWKRRIGR